jgi:hypothetical protein
MRIKDPQDIIHNFVRRLKISWQGIILVGIFVYGISFIYRMKAETTLKYASSLPVLNWISFFIAVALAIYILQIKRTYFRLKFFNQYLTENHNTNPELDKEQLLRKFTSYIGKKMKLVWMLGLVIILIGVTYYWLTFDPWNMHVYFIVGLYSLVINYPRTDLFADIPYLLKEIFPEEVEEE